ncbi:hypothetical protein JCM8547_001244 [Rhodosporidiobolus lusitaniae]
MLSRRCILIDRAVDGGCCVTDLFSNLYSLLAGTLAYCLAFVLIFLRGFNDLNPYPVTLTGCVLITIAGQPGLAVGAVLDQAVFGLLGVGIGGACFAILAKLGHSQVAQGFVLAVMVYFLALVKAASMRYFALSLLAIILAFSGIYTSILSGGDFVPGYLEAYLEAYLWGFAIVLVVNLLVFPHTSEKELRELLVLSIEHIGTFSHLIAKTYSLEITEDERKIRDSLNASIRADMGLLNAKLMHAGIEINYTRFSMADYTLAVGKIRNIQQGLITSYSSLVAMERFEPKALEVMKRQAKETSVGRSFEKLRRSLDLMLADIVAEFAVGGARYHSPAPGTSSWEDFLEDVEEVDPESGLPKQRARGNTLVRQQSDALQARLAALRDKLSAEVQTAGSTPVVSRRPSVSGGGGQEPLAPSVAEEAAKAAALADGLRGRLKDKISDPAGVFRKQWDKFRATQLQAAQKMLETGMPPDEDLFLHQPGLSVHDQFTTATAPPLAGPVKRTSSDPSSVASQDEKAVPVMVNGDMRSTEICGTTILRTMAFSAGLGRVSSELSALYEHVVKPPQPRKKKIRFHLFERSKGYAPPTKKTTMSIRAAIAKLSGHDFTPKTPNLGQRIAAFERLLRSDQSIYALKTAAAVSVYAVFLLAPSLKTFFIDYGLTSGIITIVVALAPTLGQSALTFVIQILSIAVGSLLGMAVAYAFHDVGGYAYNPYGIVCLLAVLVALPAMSLIYAKPMYFAAGLLSANSAGVLIVTEYTYGGDLPDWTRPGFDSPALRCAKQLVAMCMALAIAGIFQGFILRQPARQQLRKKLANITWSLSAYTILLGYYSEALMPLTTDSSNYPHPDVEALTTIRTELIARETIIQGELLSLMPLMKFSSVEPSFGTPFKAAVMGRVIRQHQLLLDRLRESRAALGEDGFTPQIRREFSDVLTPYRKQGKRIIRAHFYLNATSLSTKMPLPAELPPVTTARAIQHDVLVLAARLQRSEEGRAIINDPVFLRYFFYLVSYSSVAHLLAGLEPELRELFGQAEDSPFVADAKAEGSF